MSALQESLSSLTPLATLHQRRQQLCSEIDTSAADVQRTKQQPPTSTTAQADSVQAVAASADVRTATTMSASAALQQEKVILLQQRLLRLEHFIYERESHLLRSQLPLPESVNSGIMRTSLPAPESSSALPPVSTSSSSAQPVLPQPPVSSSSSAVAGPSPRYRGGKRVACQGCFHVRVSCEQER